MLEAIAETVMNVSNKEVGSKYPGTLAQTPFKDQRNNGAAFTASYTLDLQRYPLPEMVLKVAAVFLLICWLTGCSQEGPRNDIAFTDHFLNLPNGSRIHYYEEGNPQGKLLLLVHGYPTSAYLYRHIIQALCGTGDTQFHCIAMTHIGFGKSSCPGDGSAVSPLFLVDQLQAFIETKQLKNMALIVHDWGGPIGVTAGMRVADRLSHLIVLNTILTPPWSGSLDWLMDFTRRHLAEPQPLLEMAYPSIIRIVMRYLTTVPLSDVALAVYSSPFENNEGKCRVHASLNMFAKARLDGRLFEELADGIAQRWVDKPAVFIWGTEDPILSIDSDPESFARNQALLPQAETRMIEGGNHFLQEDRPVEIAMEIRHFLEHEPSQQNLTPTFDPK